MTEVCVVPYAHELALLREQLAEALATLEAIREGQVDAVMVASEGASEVFNLQSADLPYREMLEQMVEGAVSLNREHAVLYCNQFLADLVGATREALQGVSFMELLDADSQDAFARAVNRGIVAKVAAHLVRPNHELVPVQLAITPPGVHSPRRTTVIVSDLTGLQRLTRIAEARDAAEADSHAKDRFLAVLGHELRNPLAALTSSVALLRTSGALDVARRDWICESMARQVTQLNSLVDDLLDATRAAHGKIKLKKESVALSPLVTSIANSLQPNLEQRLHRLSIQIQPPGLRVAADPTRLEQILVNLITNALKYTPDGGTILVRATEDERTTYVSVYDTGHGIEERDLERIFEPFTQVTVASGGLGIGLTLVRQLVQLHGGAVRAESAGLGRGSAFHVTLPRVTIKAKAVPESPKVDVALPPSVLVVDDNEDAATLLSLLLSSQGLNVEVCHTGEGAVLAARASMPALVLLDVGLPDITGYEVAQRLRQNGHRDALIVAVTGFSHEEARAKVKAAGFDAHLVKPVTLSQILAFIAQHRARFEGAAEKATMTSAAGSAQ